MQITHEEAHRLIQFKADQGLSRTNKETLSAHLKYCVPCRSYSDELKDVESILRKTMSRQWRRHPLPFQMDAINAGVNSKGTLNRYMTMRTLSIGIAFVLFIFVSWQSVATMNTTPQPTPLLGALPLIPTPSTQFTATNTLNEGCEETRYKVQGDDTLESIVQQFSISREVLVAANNLTGESIKPGMELTIPLCESTPTSTTHPPTLTLTPFLEYVVTTPG